MKRFCQEFYIAFYLVMGFCMVALHAQTLDAPTLVGNLYEERFLSSASTRNSMSEVQIRAYLRQYMKAASNEQTFRLSKLIKKLSKENQLHPGLILSVVRVESGFNPQAVSPRGALGLMQIMPETGEWLTQLYGHRYGMRWQGPAQLLDPEFNLKLGVTYLGYLNKMFNHDLEKVLSAYNQGPAKVDEDVNEGRGLALGYYYKIKEQFGPLARGIM